MDEGREEHFKDPLPLRRHNEHLSRRICRNADHGTGDPGQRDKHRGRCAAGMWKAETPGASAALRRTVEPGMAGILVRTGKLSEQLDKRNGLLSCESEDREADAGHGAGRLRFLRVAQTAECDFAIDGGEHRPCRVPIVQQLDNVEAKRYGRNARIA